MSGSIRLFLADVDGTLVTHDKVLTDASIDAVHRLRAGPSVEAWVEHRQP